MTLETRRAEAMLYHYGWVKDDELWRHPRCDMERGLELMDAVGIEALVERMW